MSSALVTTMGDTTVPKYHYRCNGCSREWWEWRSMSQSDLDACPSCDKPKVEKVPTMFCSRSNSNEKKEIGETVEESIHESREELKNQIKTMRNKTYDDI
jgi:putative FmdB family regulatory protein